MGDLRLPDQVITGASSCWDCVVCAGHWLFHCVFACLTLSAGAWKAALTSAAHLSSFPPGITGEQILQADAKLFFPA